MSSRPALCLSAPCLASVVGLWRAGIQRRIPEYLFSPVLLFAVDVAVTLASTLAVVFRRRPKWGGKARSDSAHRRRLWAPDV